MREYLFADICPLLLITFNNIVCSLYFHNTLVSEMWAFLFWPHQGHVQWARPGHGSPLPFRCTLVTCLSPGYFSLFISLVWSSCCWLLFSPLFIWKLWRILITSPQGTYLPVSTLAMRSDCLSRERWSVSPSPWIWAAFWLLTKIVGLVVCKFQRWGRRDL